MLTVTDDTTASWPGGLVQVVPSKLEARANENLIRLRTRVDALRKRLGGRPPRVKPFSALAGDDEACRPYQVSHAAWSAISHAIDNVISAYDMTVTDKGGNHYAIVTRPHAVYPMLRAAYENSFRALWLLAAPSRQQRVERRLRMQFTDARMRDKFADLTKSAQGRQHEVVLEKLKPIARDNQVSNRRLTSEIVYRHVIREASHDAGLLTPDEAEAIWCALSGLAHGDFWAMLSVLEREQVSVSPDGNVVTFLTSSPTTAVGALIQIAVDTTDAALAAFDDKATIRFPGAGI